MLIDYNVIHLLLIAYVLIGISVASLLSLVMTGIKKDLNHQDEESGKLFMKRRAVTGIRPEATAIRV